MHLRCIRVIGDLGARINPRLTMMFARSTVTGLIIPHRTRKLKKMVTDMVHNVITFFKGCPVTLGGKI